MRLAARSARSILSRSRLLRAESDSAPERARGRGGREVARALGCPKWLWSPLMGTAELGMWDGSGGKSVAVIARDFNPAVIGEVGGKLSIRTKAGGYPDPQVKQVLACQSIILFDKRKGLYARRSWAHWFTPDRSWAWLTSARRGWARELLPERGWALWLC